MKMYLQHNYKTSKDYERLFELIKTQRVVCFVEGKYPVKEICWSSFESSDTAIEIGAGGTFCIYANGVGSTSIKEDFIEQCKKRNLEYIEPREIEDDKR